MVNNFVEESCYSLINEPLYEAGSYIMKAGDLKFINKEKVHVCTQLGIFSFKEFEKSGLIMEISDQLVHVLDSRGDGERRDNSRIWSKERHGDVGQHVLSGW